MANADLYGKTNFKVPDGVANALKKGLSQFEGEEGTERAKNILARGEISYSLAKRLKNYFDHANGESGTPRYALYGGTDMKVWVNQSLGNSRAGLVRSKTVKSNLGFENQFRRTHEKKYISPSDTSISSLKVPRVKRIELFEDLVEGESRSLASICTILDKQGRLLILERAKIDEWMPGKWGLPGGKVEEDENPDDAIYREVKEETNLELDALDYCFKCTEENGTDVYVFIGVCRDKNSFRLTDREHSDHRWVYPSELKTYDTVPELLEYISRCAEVIQKKALPK
jgi:8-oxo-dGTP diphosphatase